MSCCCTMLLIAAALGGDDSSMAIKVDSVVVTLLEQVEVPARERGELLVVSVREGQLVKRGEELARIDDTEAKLEHDHADVALQRAKEEAQNKVKMELAKKELALAQIELDRAKASIDRFKRAFSDSEIDLMQLKVDKSALAVEQSEREFALAQFDWRASEAALAIAARHIERRRIVAPISGVVVQINQHQGEWVEPGETLMRILQIDRLRVEGFLDARFLGQDLTGRGVTLRTSVGERDDVEFRGVLRFVSPEVDPVDGKVRVWAEIENHDLNLRPGMRGAMIIGDMAAETTR